MADISHGHFNNLVQFLNPKAKNIDVERIDLEQALEGFLMKFVPHLTMETLSENGISKDPISTFSYAGHVIQSSVNVYGRKIDGLYSEVRSLMDDLTVQRQRAEERKKDRESGEAQGDKRQEEDDDWRDWYDVVPLGKHIYLTEEDEENVEPIEYIVDPPSCMIELHSDPATRIPLWELQGKIIGYQQDFAMGSAFTFSSTGELSLSMNYDVLKEKLMEASGYLDAIEEEHFEPPIQEDVCKTSAVAPEPDVPDNYDPGLSSDDEGGDVVKDIKREKHERKKKLQERLQAAIEPHDPYEVIELRDETKAEKKIHEPITNLKRAKDPLPPIDARELLTKVPLGKGPRKPDDAFKNEADKELLARKKNIALRAKKNKDVVQPEETEEEDSASEWGEDEEKPFDPVTFSFDEVQVHAEDPQDDIEDALELQQEGPTASRNAAMYQLNMEENKKAFESWSQKMQRVLDAEKTYPEHDMGATMREILANMENKSGCVPFEEVTEMNSIWDISRVFLSTLMLTNNGNLDIIEPERTNLPRNYTDSDLPVDKMQVKFITKENTKELIRPEKEVEEADRRARRRQHEEESSSSDEGSDAVSSVDESSSNQESPQPHSSKSVRLKRAKK